MTHEETSKACSNVLKLTMTDGVFQTIARICKKAYEAIQRQEQCSTAFTDKRKPIEDTVSELLKNLQQNVSALNSAYDEVIAELQFHGQKYFVMKELK